MFECEIPILPAFPFCFVCARVCVCLCVCARTCVRACVHSLMTIKSRRTDANGAAHRDRNLPASRYGFIALYQASAHSMAYKLSREG